MGFLGLTDDDAPQRQVANFDPYTSQLLTGQISDALKKPDEGAIAKNYQAGQDVYDQFKPGLIQTGMNQAIKDKYGSLLRGEIGKMKNQERLNIRSDQLNKIKQAQQANVALMSVQNEAMTANLEAQNMKEVARANAINSILNLGVTAAGFAFGGGAGGGVAAAGSQKGLLAGGGQAYGSGPGGGGGRSSLTDYGSPGMNQSMGYKDDLEMRYRS
jgi:hypothetical protein